MKPNKRLASLISCVITLSFVIAQGSSDRRRMRDSRSVTLPSYAILDEHSEPLIASDGKAGFISSVTGGLLISFSMKTGKVISSMAVGNTVGPISMIEDGGRRLIAVPAANDPDQGHPATISVIDATSARNLALKSLLVLPLDSRITPATRALLTADGRYCLIASSFTEPELMAFDIETGQMTSQLPLFGRPSEISVYDNGERRAIAVVSAEANHLSIFRLDREGYLSSAASFTPYGASFTQSNNPVFSANGRAIYIAASTGDQLLAIDTDSGAQFGGLEISSPQRVTVTTLSDGGEMIGVTRSRRPVDNGPGGVTIVEVYSGRLSVRAEFTPPDDIEFSRANNVEFDEDASVAFIGSTTGLLFAFSTETGELEANQVIGSELRRVALNHRARALAAVRSSSSGDEVVIVEFDTVDGEEPEIPAPVITSLKPDVTDQGRVKNLNLLVQGENFTEGSVLVVNGEEVAAESTKKGKALAAKLRKEMFDQPGDILVQVRGANGELSGPAALRVVRPVDPVIERIKPDEVPGPAEAFTLKVSGKNFRPSSTIFLAGQPLNTTRLDANSLQAQVPSDLAGSVRKFAVQVRDLAISDVVSNEKDLNVFGPRIRELKPSVDAVVAGAGNFKLRIQGENFRDGAQVEINGETFPANRVLRSSGTSMRLNVPRRFAQSAGKLAIVVRNPEGNASEAVSIDAHAPEIESFDPGKLLAGTKDIKVDIRGENFRKRARVYVGKEDGLALRVPKQRVRFRSDKRIVVTLSEELNKLLKQPGQLKFQIVNPNDGDGVPSTDLALEVVGPEISRVTIKNGRSQNPDVNLVIEGANFRKGAIVEFVKANDVFRQDTPVKLNEGRLVITLRAKKLSALAGFQVRVVNPGKVISNAFDLPAVANDN